MLQCLEQFSAPVLDGRTAGFGKVFQLTDYTQPQLSIFDRKVCQSLQGKGYLVFILFFRKRPRT
jgi:hypothetical protein